MKYYFAPLVAAFLLAASGCGITQPRPSSAAQEEVRHPSNDMIPLPKEEPKHHESKRLAANARSAKSLHPPAFDDPRKIPAGIDYAEMLRRFGPPTMRINDGPARTTYSYAKLKTQVQVEVRNGKVVSVAAVNTGF